jgi:hypothetical protein
MKCKDCEYLVTLYYDDKMLLEGKAFRCSKVFIEGMFCGYIKKCSVYKKKEEKE